MYILREPDSTFAKKICAAGTSQQMVIIQKNIERASSGQRAVHVIHQQHDALKIRRQFILAQEIKARMCKG